MKLFSFFIVFTVLLAMSCLGQDCSRVANEYQSFVEKIEAKGFKISNFKETVFSSGDEKKIISNLESNKEYVILLITEKRIDQSGISILNKFGLVVQSNFKETGSDRHFVIIQFNPISSGLYDIIFKTIDFSGRNVCGYYAIFEKVKS